MTTKGATMIPVRAKLQLTHRTDSAIGNTQAKHLTFSAVHDPSIPEEQRFAKTTPNAEFRITVDNPNVIDQLKLGGFYYVDFVPTQA